MNNFTNDYSRGAHPLVLEKLVAINDQLHKGYGYDAITEEASSLIKEKINNQNIDIHFFTGGTQLNLVALSSFTKGYEAIISSSIGHINTLEAGSIEACGRKIIPVYNTDGKVYPNDIVDIVQAHPNENFVKPKIVYISNAAENGLIYTYSEIQQLYQTCQENNLLFFIDGARIAYAIANKSADLTLEKIANNCDAFYIGGTKNGMLSGECLVIVNDTLKPDFRYNMKQRGAILAKTWPVSASFIALMENDVFFSLANHSNEMALYLGNKLSDIDLIPVHEIMSNQIFIDIKLKTLAKISDKFQLTIMSKTEDYARVRLVCAYDTKKEDIDLFINILSLAN